MLLSWGVPCATAISTATASKVANFCIVQINSKLLPEIIRDVTIRLLRELIIYWKWETENGLLICKTSFVNWCEIFSLVTKRRIFASTSPKNVTLPKLILPFPDLKISCKSWITAFGLKALVNLNNLAMVIARRPSCDFRIFIQVPVCWFKCDISIVDFKLLPTLFERELNSSLPLNKKIKSIYLTLKKSPNCWL